MTAPGGPDADRDAGHHDQDHPGAFAGHITREESTWLAKSSSINDASDSGWPPATAACARTVCHASMAVAGTKEIAILHFSDQHSIFDFD